MSVVWVCRSVGQSVRLSVGEGSSRSVRGRRLSVVWVCRSDCLSVRGRQLSVVWVGRSVGRRWSVGRSDCRSVRGRSEDCWSVRGRRLSVVWVCRADCRSVGGRWGRSVGSVGRTVGRSVGGGRSVGRWGVSLVGSRGEEKGSGQGGGERLTGGGWKGVAVWRIIVRGALYGCGGAALLSVVKKRDAPKNEGKSALHAGGQICPSSYRQNFH